MERGLVGGGGGYPCTQMGLRSQGYGWCGLSPMEAEVIHIIRGFMVCPFPI